VFLAELAASEKSGNMARLTIIRLGNDGANTAAAAADNDYALGMFVEGISKSRFWGNSAVFVIPASAENGADHIDSHRAPALVISPFVRRRVVDHNMYNTASMLRTMELLLGMRPMTQFDAGARPIAAVFQMQANPAPYAAEKPRVPAGRAVPGN